MNDDYLIEDEDKVYIKEIEYKHYLIKLHGTKITKKRFENNKLIASWIL